MISYKGYIDGLRAISIIGVILYHAFPESLPHGYLGVDIFFAISGYLITSIIIQEISESRFSIREFYARRIRRILPSVTLVSFSVLFFGWFSLLPSEYMELGQSGVAGLTFWPNFYFHANLGYFDKSGELKPLLNLWSLGIEEQFYLAWPLTLVALSRTSTTTSIRTVWIITLSSLALFLFSNSTDNAKFFLPQYRIWQLAAGSLVALHQLQASALLSRAGATIPTIALALIIHTFFSDQFESFNHLIVTINTCLLLLTGSSAGHLKVFLENKIIVYIGKISFVLYLWHYPIFSFLRIIETTPTAVQIFLATLLSVALSVLTHHYFENPVRFTKKIKPSFIIASTIICAILFNYTKNMSGFPLRMNEFSAWDDFKWDSAFIGANQCRTNFSLGSKDVCLTTSIDKPPKLMLVGDSHANHLFYGLAAIDAFRNLNITNIDLIPGSPGYHNALKLTKTIKPPIIFISFYAKRFNKDFALQTLNLVNELQSYGIQVVYILDNPEMPFNPEKCLARPFRVSKTMEDCTFNHDQEKYQDYKFFISDLQKLNVKIANTSHALCTNKTCTPMISGSMMYRDTHHLSYKGSLLVGSHLASQIDLAH